MGDACQALAIHCDLIRDQKEVRRFDGETKDLEGWLETVCDSLRLELTPVKSEYGRLEDFLSRAAPALIVVSQSVYALAPGAGDAHLIAPDLSIRRVPRRLLCELVAEEHVEPHRAEIERLALAVNVPAARQARVRSALLKQRMGNNAIGNVWLLGTARPEINRRRLLGQGAIASAAYAAQYAAWLGSWWILGRAILQERYDRGWLLAWLLLLISVVLLRLLGSFVSGRALVELGAVIKQRLLRGALALVPDEIRHQGSGTLLGHVLEAEAVESAALSGGLAFMNGSIELCAAIAVFVFGEHGGILLVLLAAWLFAAAILAAVAHRRRQLWTRERTTTTQLLAEHWLGQRTRLAQEDMKRWHETEDLAIAAYSERAQKMDRANAFLVATVPRGWLVVAVIGWAPAFAHDTSAASLALLLGGVLLAFQALRMLSQSFAQLSAALAAADRIAFLWQAAARTEPAGALEASLSENAPADLARPLVEGRALRFAHSARKRPVLASCSFAIGARDRIWLTGSSGGGKSTFAATLTGLRAQDSGLLLLRGLDQHSVGPRLWRSCVTSAAQFGENHVFSASFAFNLLMGRAWPPSPADLAAAQAVCEELGLAELIQRMPSGLEQTVGETGWQLSHGERSRLFVARALLQDADLLILDESLAALDPETMRQVIQCVDRRARALLVIAHP